MTYIKSNTTEQEYLVEDEPTNNKTKLFFWLGSVRTLKAILKLQSRMKWFKREQILLAFNVGDLEDPTYYKRIRQALEKYDNGRNNRPSIKRKYHTSP